MKNNTIIIKTRDILILGIVIIIAIVAGLIYISQQHNPKTKNKKQIAINKINKITNLGNQPTKVSTINNLDNEIIKANGGNKGDLLLVYEQKRKAIIWRPQKSKIVAMIDTTRGDGLDLSQKINLIIYYNVNNKQAVDNLSNKIRQEWPETVFDIKIKPIEKEIKQSFIAPGAKATKYTYQDIHYLVEKINLPINPVPIAKSNNHQIVIYLKSD